MQLPERLPSPAPHSTNGTRLIKQRSVAHVPVAVSMMIDPKGESWRTCQRCHQVDIKEDPLKCKVGDVSPRDSGQKLAQMKKNNTPVATRDFGC